MAPEGAYRDQCTGRDRRRAIPTSSPECKFCTPRRHCHAVPVPPRASRPESYPASEETAFVSRAKTDHELRTVPIRRTRPETGNRSQLCPIHPSVHLRTIPTESPAGFSKFGLGMSRTSFGARLQVQSWGRSQLLVTALRSFLCYLRYHGKIKTDLNDCVPPVARWSFATLPIFPQPANGFSRTEEAGTPLLSPGEVLLNAARRTQT